MGATVVGCAPSDDSPSALSCPTRSLPWATSPATCAGPGTRRRRTSSRPSTPTCGSPPATTRSGCSAPSAGPGSRSWPPTTRFLEHARRGPGRPRALPHRRPLVPAAGPATDAPRAIAYFSPGVRHHRRAAAVLRRPRHPRRRPPQGRQRPRRADRRRRPALPARLLPAVALPRGLAAGDLPGPRPRRAAALAAARGRRLARARSRSPCPAAPSCSARIWVAQVGRVPLLLLDSDVEENPDHYREVTDRLYGGNSEHRLRQELLLGVGGVRALRAYSRITGAPEPEVFHTNEGHAGFLGLERIRELTVAGNGPGSTSTPRSRSSRAVHRLHHPHPGAGRHRPVPARPWSSSTSAAPAPAPGVPVEPDPRARRRGLRGRRRRRSSTWR